MLQAGLLTRFQEHQGRVMTLGENRTEIDVACEPQQQVQFDSRADRVARQRAIPVHEGILVAAKRPQITVGSNCFLPEVGDEIPDVQFGFAERREVPIDEADPLWLQNDLSRIKVPVYQTRRAFWYQGTPFSQPRKQVRQPAPET